MLKSVNIGLGDLYKECTLRAISAFMMLINDTVKSWMNGLVPITLYSDGESSP